LPWPSAKIHVVCGDVTPSPLWVHFQNEFERMQGGILGGDFLSNSSYGVDDLPSDFLGFMIQANMIQSVNEVCGEPLSEGDSQRMYTFGYGPKKNRSHVPALWKWLGWSANSGSGEYPTLSEDNGCDPCRDKDTTIPSIFNKYSPSLDSSRVRVWHSFTKW
jgi:hypothetical protein